MVVSERPETKAQANRQTTHKFRAAMLEGEMVLDTGLSAQFIFIVLDYYILFLLKSLRETEDEEFFFLKLSAHKVAIEAKICDRGTDEEEKGLDPGIVKRHMKYIPARFFIFIHANNHSKVIKIFR